MNHYEVVNETSKWIQWWVNQRKGKLKNHLSGTMSVNPFMLPVIFDIHNISSFEELGELLIGSHLMTGHSTGFGKLVDEKILPNVFKTIKLDKAYRSKHSPLHKSMFDEIDHIIELPNGKNSLLSLKAGKWTIQLTMAVQLNKSFEEILSNHGDIYEKIVVGVFYGKKDDLTDKYDILRGINRGANHDVTDLTEHVDVCSGAEFWKWINNGEEKTQDWVMEGNRSPPLDKAGD